ncbi:hypothetical protein ACP6EK_02375 [Candidatus Caldatribacterium sp. SIUC1]|uniref:hypothetical protein n=1 Tax=Candidatus Caldatribacterium sp. SIUC1 TaxID=3418365 RepID=UPI003F68CDDA
MKWLGTGLVILGMLFGVALSGETGNLGQYARTPEETGVLVLRGLRIEGGTVYLTVATRGCTTKEDVVAQVVERALGNNRTPYYELTFLRETPDTCKGELREESLVYDLEDDLHLELPCVLLVTNPVVCSPAKDGFLEETPREEDLMLREDLRDAAIWAVKAEIQRYQESDHPDKDAKISALREILARLQHMSPEDYPLPSEEQPQKTLPTNFGVLLPPEIREVDVVSPPQRIGDLLEVVGMTRSGPFYHVAGIRGRDFSVFAPSSRYRLKLYLVYRREYFLGIPNYYVYVASWEER